MRQDDAGEVGRLCLSAAPARALLARSIQSKHLLPLVPSKCEVVQGASPFRNVLGGIRNWMVLITREVFWD